MENAYIDENSRPTLTAIASDGSGEIVELYADKITHRLLVQDSGSSSRVRSVTGTADRITVDNTDPDNPIVDIASTYAGQDSITTLGTITTGVWNATDIGLAAGGTGASLSDPNYDAIFVWDNTTNATRLAELSGITYDSSTNTLSVAGATTPDLQGVLDEGNTAEDQSITFESSTTADTTVIDEFGVTVNDGNGSQTFIDSTSFNIRQSSNQNSIVSASINSNRTQTLQNKSGTLAHLDDISLATLGISATASEINVLDGITATTAELNYTDGVTSNIQTQLNSKAADSDVVKLTGNQTVAGIKTFSSFPVTPSSAPTSDYEVANKKYVDDQIPSFETDGTPNTVQSLLNLAAGSNITLTDEGDGTVTIDASGGGGGITWAEVTGTSQTASVDTGYILNNVGLVTLTLPSTAAVGSVVRVAGKGAGGWRIAQNSGQTIHFGTEDTTTGTSGNLSSTEQYDAIELLCITANTDFVVLSVQGNIEIDAT